MKLSIVIPAYNEKENLFLLMEKFEEMRSKLNAELEILIVDDGSTDGTFEEAKRLSGVYNYIKVLRHSRNLGKTAALDTGFSYATGEIFGFWDADLQYDPMEIPKLYTKLSEGYDIVAGWKQGKYEKAFVSSIYNKLARILFGLKIHDLNSVKIFHRKVYEKLVMRPDWHRYLIPVAVDYGFSVTEEKITLYPRKFGESKYRGPWRAITGFLDLLSVKFMLSFTKKPMLLFGTAGLISCFLALLVGLFAFYSRFELHFGYRPLIYLVILLFISGLLLFTLGFLAEILSTMLHRIESVEKRIKAKDER